VTPSLIQRTGRAAFWNALLVPAGATLALVFAVLVRRRFGLYAGVYDTAQGVAGTLMMFTSLGIANSLTKFLPEIEAESGPAAVILFLKRVGAVRLLLLAIVLLPLNLFAPQIAAGLDLGAQGVLILRLVSILVFGRVLIELVSRTLNAFFDHLRTNLLSLLQGVLDVALVGAAVIGGYQIAGVLGMVVLSASITAAVGWSTARRTLARLTSSPSGAEPSPADRATTAAAVAAQQPRFFGYSLFMFLFDLSNYFADIAFATPALAILLGYEQVALFAAAFNLSFRTVGLMVASFRGVYRPMFAHLRARNDPEQLRRAFAGVSKAQLVLLLPAGVGLIVMAGDYLPLMFGAEYAAAVPAAQLFVALMYTQTAFNLGVIWLSVDERYRAVLWCQSILVFAAPFFLIAAGSRGFVWAAAVFGGARVLSSLSGYLLCYRWYGFRFPWWFGAKIGAVAAVMGALLAAARTFLGRSVAEAVVLTIAGALIYALGLRLARILGAEEIDLLERSDMPGKRWLLAWLAPGR
jgi:O-antigen/teichoic acid export membrane protein